MLGEKSGDEGQLQLTQIESTLDYIGTNNAERAGCSTSLDSALSYEGIQHCNSKEAVQMVDLHMHMHFISRLFIIARIAFVKSYS